ncbi:hypothetical protein VUJ46_17700 [Chryseobacterium sp. MYb264]|uniref:hypothetical protein n=1 Tax=Chryseobacterium sp. MYb264 TaxID=2745153 RepID=UPI002E14A747|nr:hypothetical protein VUJ46_17700 [Chryseobacterium sp. MYb264]
MKNVVKLNAKKLSRELLKKIEGGSVPIDGGGCKWPECMNNFGRCSRIFCI